MLSNPIQILGVLFIIIIIIIKVKNKINCVLSSLHLFNNL